MRKRLKRIMNKIILADKPVIGSNIMGFNGKKIGFY